MADETNPAVPLSYNKEAPADSEIVTRIRRGDLDSFELLVRRHQKQMLNIAFRLLGDYDEACECVQDAFVSAFRNIGTFRGEAKFTTWLTAITLNAGRNRLKQLKSRSARIAYSIGTPNNAGDGDIQADLPSREPSALDRMQEQDLRSKVRDCIETLDPEYREVIILRDLQDFSYAEIGTALGVREGTVKSRLFRARDAVRECLKKAWGNL